jgi:hypothetical protein
MPTILMISRHPAESCPLFNEKARKVYLEYGSKLEGMLKKHGIKAIANCTVPNEHLSVIVSEAPSLEAFNKLCMEPEIMALNAYETYEIKLALNAEEAFKMLRQAK